MMVMMMTTKRTATIVPAMTGILLFVAVPSVEGVFENGTDAVPPVVVVPRDGTNVVSPAVGVFDVAGIFISVVEGCDVEVYGWPKQYPVLNV